MSSPFTRREFTRATLGAAAVLAAGVETARGYAANDTIHVGCIGTGGRCRDLMSRFPKIPGVKIVAVCDVWDVHREEGRKLADPQAAVESDYRKLLDRNDIDAVLIGTPDHWHVPITVDACAAGKDVYVEKPLTHDLSEGPRVIEAQNNNNRVVQVGTQQRSARHFQEAARLVQDGGIGELRTHAS